MLNFEKQEPSKLVAKNEADEMLAVIIDLDEQVSIEGRVVNSLTEVFGSIFGLHSFFYTVVAFSIKGTLNRALIYDKVISTNRFSPDLQDDAISDALKAD